ncbi:ABC transporter substrate-binding protein, partial [Salmonella enterica]|uniref:ABC transporter substrate-binding protein n=1 Tax=Salmonella enterica TaxID=28901 RepID=UPI00329A519E
YLINQNYSHGQQVSRYAKEMLKRKRPDIEIVGDDLAPLAQVRDFAPYVAKIKQSGADSVITGNWGSDLALLIKDANDAGLSNVNFYT